MEASALSASAGLGRGSVPSPWLRLRSDEQLVGLFRSGSEEAFRVIHDRYRPRLHAYARQMLRSPADAEDVLQDVFLRAYRSLRDDERPVTLRAWLYRVAHNRCIDGLRRPVPAIAEVYDVSRRPCQDTWAEVERRDDLQRLVDDVRRLPEQQRSALLMREMDGMSYADLAAALDTSVPAVKSLLVRARIGLVEALDARDTDCSDIRHDLAASYDRGVRASGRARRHLRDCDNCTTYRAQLRAVRQGFASLSPAPAAGLFAKLVGLGGAGSGAAAGGAAAGSGTTAAIGGGAAVAASVTKVAAIVCCAAALTGGAVEVASPVSSPRPRPARSVEFTPAPAAARDFSVARPAPVRPGRAHHAPKAVPYVPATAIPAPAPAPTVEDNGAGGEAAPAGLEGTDPPAVAPAGADAGAATDPASSDDKPAATASTAPVTDPSATTASTGGSSSNGSGTSSSGSDPSSGSGSSGAGATGGGGGTPILPSRAH